MDVCFGYQLSLVLVLVLLVEIAIPGLGPLSKVVPVASVG